ncbi:ABC transporter ATP-binding protein [Arcobacter sp.]|uniref:ABC transporter ATP-binding protein n=1 Tax=Arcobacter sp. TaxID=1872629 RepID=UPI003D11223A
MKKQQIKLKNIFKLIIENKKDLLWGQLFTFIAICISIPIPLMLPALVDEVLLNKPNFFVNNIDYFFSSGNAFYYIAIVTVAVILLRIFYFLFSAITTKIFTKISKFVTFKIRETILLHLKQVNMNEYESMGSGAITSNLVTDVNTLDGFIINGASKFISSILTLIGVSVVMITIHPILGLMILFIQPIIILLSKKISKNVGVLKKKENEAVEKFQNNLGETLDLFGQIKASNKEKYFFNQSIKNALNVKETSDEFNFKSVAYERFSFTIFLIAFEVLRASGLVMVAYSDLSIGMMFAMFGYIWFIMTPIQDILSIQYSYANASAALKRINKILELNKENTGTIELDDNNNLEISIKNLYFSYTEDKTLLKDITLDIKPKDKVALIGASGSGKTTLAQIISGFYHKNSGEITYNGISIDEINKESLRKNIFLVLQMPILFNNTLRFNISMDNENISDEEIFEALKTAQLYDSVQDMPNGLDTILGKHGIRLSGGQRQRLSIARMIVSKAKVVIFDESTSALDVHTETKLFNSLQPILKDKTVITIAHRLSTVKNADKIFVLDNGEIVQSGNHDELEDIEGHYQDFIRNQLI